MIKKTVFAALVACAALSAPAAAAESDVLRKLDAVIAKQDEILKRLDAVQAELQIVKVRATQR